jgi:hypothetical protein
MQVIANSPYLSRAYTNIIIWNLIPYLGVFFGHWSPVNVFICYSLETVVIGIFNVFRLIAVYRYGATEPEGEGPGDLGIFAIPAFMLSYGFLAYLQLVLFFTFCGLVRGEHDHQVNSVSYSLNLVFDNRSLYLAMSIFALSNVYSLIYGFIIPKNYLHTTMNQQMAQPIPRVFVSQLVVYIGAALYGMFGDPWIILVALTFVKMIAEVYMLTHSAIEIMEWD